MDYNWLCHPGLEGLNNEEVTRRLEDGMRLAKVPFDKILVITTWLRGNPDRWFDWPWGVLISRLWEVYFGSGPMASARGAKKNVVNRVEGIFGEPFGDPALVENDAYPIPYSSPPPKINWQQTRIKFTLQAACGMRSDCERAAQALGSSVDDGKRPGIVVVGFLGDYHRWHSSSIESALGIWDAEDSNSTGLTEGRPIYLVSEQEWLRQVNPCRFFQSSNLEQSQAAESTILRQP